MYTYDDLKEGQKMAYDAVFDDESTSVMITGAAGTGKTVAVATTIHDLVEDGHRVLVTATTNKAAAVLRRMLGGVVKQANIRTIHSALGLKLKRNMGRDYLVQAGQSITSSFDYVFIDETSMMNQELWGFVREEIECSYGTKYVFIGDPYQLPPVNEEESPVFSAHEIEDHVDLVEILRTNDDNPIGFLVDSIREHDRIPPVPSGSEHNAGFGWWSLDSATWNKQIEKVISQYGTEIDADLDYFRVLAYTRDRVADLNHTIRSIRYGRDAQEPYVVGEKLIANEAVSPSASPTGSKDSGDVLIQNSDELEVTEVEETSHCGFDAYLLTLESMLIGGTFSVYVPTLESAPLVEERKIDLFNAAREAKRSRELWGAAYMFAESWAPLHYAYALTIHKAQGSTIKNVFLDWPNVIMRNPHGPVHEKRKLLYVGATRASERLIILS